MKPEKRAYPKNVKRPRTKFSARPGRVIRMEGQKFGELTVVARASRNARGYITWRCRCACGEEVVIDGGKLRAGVKTQCSASKHAALRGPPLTIKYKSEYQSWENMRVRCTDTTHKGYKNYGGRGIKVCQEWQSFEQFLRDMGRKPHPKYTIERTNVDGDYEPGNCRWVSRQDQNRNKRNSVFVTYQGKRMLLIDLVEQLNLSRGVVYGRLKAGWTLAQALALPVHRPAPKPKKKRKYTRKVYEFTGPPSIEELLADPIWDEDEK